LEIGLSFQLHVLRRLRRFEGVRLRQRLAILD
jgi:hypothetical protein